jgi:hypothetical protein
MMRLFCSLDLDVQECFKQVESLQNPDSRASLSLEAKFCFGNNGWEMQMILVMCHQAVFVDIISYTNLF